MNDSHESDHEAVKNIERGQRNGLTFSLTEDQRQLVVQFVDLGNSIIQSTPTYDKESLDNNPEMAKRLRADLVELGKIASELNSELKGFITSVPWVIFEIIEIIARMGDDSVIDLAKSLPPWIMTIEDAILSN